MATNKLPTCTFCINGQFVDHGIVNEKTGAHLLQCGGGVAGTESQDRKPGCGRIVMVTEKQMNAGGQI